MTPSSGPGQKRSLGCGEWNEAFVSSSMSMQRLVGRLVRKYQIAMEAGRRLRVVFLMLYGLEESFDEENSVCGAALR